MKNQTKEVWKDVAGFEGQYKISSFGRLKHFTKRFGWNVLKNTNKKNGYFSVILRHSDGYNKYTRIHRLVAETFIENPLNLPTVNHIDMNKQNNCVENLEWCTYKENNKKARELKPQIIYGMVKYNTETRPNKILQYTLDGEFVSEHINAQEAGRITGVCPRNILQVANKTPYNKRGATRGQAGGFVWKTPKEVML